ncbi:cytochrome P450 [Xylaria scruposa]|nr:cytochrome P450 [Xylaria scruposa]
MTIISRDWGDLLSTIIYNALILVVIYVSSTIDPAARSVYIIYQRFFHRLSKYPGPFLASLSDAYGGFYAGKKCLHLMTRENQLKYGAVVRQGPNKLVFSSISALRDIYKNDRVSKPKVYTAIGSGAQVNIFTAADKQLHRSRRQLIGQILTDRSMHAFEPIITQRIDILLNQLLDSARASYAVNLSGSMRRLSMDVAGLLGFGFDLNLQKSNENAFMFTTLDTIVPRGNVFYHFFSLRAWLRWLSMLLSRRILEQYMGLVEKTVSTRMSEEIDARHDLYSLVANVLDSESAGLRKSELWAEANFILTAAGETTRTAMCVTLFYLSRSPTCYRKLVNEIRGNFPTGSAINGAALNNCRYLRACINEALRMSPPGPGVLWREKDPNDVSNNPLIIDGHVIPPGTVFGINTYSLHHNEDYFPNSFVYSPDRWLDSKNSEQANLVRDAFAPFSIGPRACAGKSMAYLEIGLVLAKIVWYFDFEKASGKLGEIGAGNPNLGLGREKTSEFQLYEMFTSNHDGPYLIFKPRSDVYKEIPEHILSHFPST